MTNDGELANALTRAAAKVEKVYLVKVSGKPAESGLEQLRSGIMIERGKPGSREGRVMTQPTKIKLIRDAENPWYEMTLTEGRNRELRKMFEEIGHHVEKIRRVGYGPLVLDVEPGEFRELSDDEVEKLKRATRAAKAGHPVTIPARPTKKAEAVPGPRPRKASSARVAGSRPSAGKTGRFSSSPVRKAKATGSKTRSKPGPKPGSKTGSKPRSG